MQGDRIIYQLQGGKMVRTANPVLPEDRYNFVIVCEFGDWSGFRTLIGCQRQFHELEDNGRPDSFYSVVERL